MKNEFLKDYDFIKKKTQNKLLFYKLEKNTILEVNRLKVKCLIAC
jgi:hypothetical protein